MKIEQSFEIIYRLCALFAVFAPLAMCAGMRDKKQTKRTTAAVPGRRGHGQKKLVKRKPRGTAKTATAPPLSAFDQALYDRYLAGRQFKTS